MHFKVRHYLQGAHVHATFFVGPEPDALASIGSLCMDEADWAALKAILLNEYSDHSHEVVCEEEKTF